MILFSKNSSFFFNIFLFALLLLAILGLLNIYVFSPTVILEISVIIFLLSNKFSIKKEVFGFFILIFSYVILSYFYAVIINKNNLFDFLLIYKAFIYVLYLLFILEKKSVNVSVLVKLFDFLMIIFLIKYSYTFFLEMDRTKILVYDENNFELMLLFLLFIFKYNFNNKIKIKDFLIVLLICFMSGSRSGISIFLLISIFMFTRSKNLIFYLKYIYFLPILIYPLVLLFKIRSKGSDISYIDRYSFFQAFLDETSNFSFMNYLFGSERITELSIYTCRKFSFYEELFSFRGDGTCYSNVFVSYILRVIYDHGIFLFVFLIFLYFKILKISGYANFTIFLVLLVIFLNSLSVSSFNSIYSLIGVMLFIISNNNSNNQKLKW